MRRDVAIKPPRSSFLNLEKDTELILRKLFIESKPYCNELKRLLVINTPDCLDDRTSEVYKKVDAMSLAQLIKGGYIRTTPKLLFPEHEEVKTYVLMTFDNQLPNETNPQFRDCTVSFDVIGHTDTWDLGDYRQRPLKIIGQIDGILNNTKLTGIGTFQFLGCKQMIMNEEISGYTLIYQAIHGSDDQIPFPDENIPIHAE